MTRKTHTTLKTSIHKKHAHKIIRKPVHRQSEEELQGLPEHRPVDHTELVEHQVFLTKGAEILDAIGKRRDVGLVDLQYNIN